MQFAGLIKITLVPLSNLLLFKKTLFCYPSSAATGTTTAITTVLPKPGSFTTTTTTTTKAMSSSTKSTPSRPTPFYQTAQIGTPGTLDHRVYLLDKDNERLSYFHDVALFASNDLYNMIVEIPKNTNPKMEICKEEPFNPIKQDVKNGKPRCVSDFEGYKGYPWNYGAFPKTWEDPNQLCSHTGLKGDCDPLDVVEIGSTVGVVGQIKVVKILGVLALLDQGETDWKVIVIDVSDPKASLYNDIADVPKEFLDSTRHWFKTYKVPEGKPENHFAFDGEFKNKDFALEIIKETHNYWNSLMKGSTPKQSKDYSICCENKSVEFSPFRTE